MAYSRYGRLFVVRHDCIACSGVIRLSNGLRRFRFFGDEHFSAAEEQCGNKRRGYTSY